MKMVTYFHLKLRVYNRGCKEGWSMNTIVSIIIVAFAVAVFAYLFSVLSEQDKNEKGTCNSEDYEIADKIAARKNN